MILPKGVRIKRTRILPYIGGMITNRSISAVTIRTTIHIHPDRTITDKLIQHELVHVEQWAEHPWTFPLRYAWNHLKYGYKDNPYEIEARSKHE